MSRTAVGAYGLRVTGVDPAEGVLGPVPDHYPPIHVQFRHGVRPFGESSVGPDRVTFVLDQGRGLDVDRATSCATYWGERPPPPADAVHPVLTGAAAAAGRWLGHELFHGAGLVYRGAVWGILGDKGAGKSTLVASLHQRGHAVLCDDLLVVRGMTAYAGPRCIDLRRDSARWLGAGVDVETESPRERWRVALPPIPPEAEMRGWVLLAWGDEAEVAPVLPGDLLAGLGRHRTWRGTALDPVALLNLAALPAVELRRPLGLESLDSAAGTLLPALDRLS